jgi:hypothetical protein
MNFQKQHFDVVTGHQAVNVRLLEKRRIKKMRYDHKGYQNGVLDPFDISQIDSLIFFSFIFKSYSPFIARLLP